MAKQKKEDNRDVFEKALDYLPEAAVVGSALAGRYVGRKGARKYIDEAMRSKTRPKGMTAEEADMLKTQAGRERYVRDSGQGAAVAYSIPAGALALGYRGAEMASDSKKRRK